MRMEKSMNRLRGFTAALAGLVGVVWSLGSGAGPAAGDIELRGFVESGYGVRMGDVGAPAHGLRFPPGYTPPVWARTPDFTLRETRLQLRGNTYSDIGEAVFRVDLINDQVRGGGVVTEIREAHLKFNTFADHLEVRAGRQPTTWGTGDLLFINDLFPKDWRSFYAGRDDQYLKSPSDALRLGVFGLPLGVDLVYTPQFAPDLIPQGTRFVFSVPAPLPLDQPDHELNDVKKQLSYLHDRMEEWALTTVK